MERPPTSRDRGEHVLGLGTDSAEPPRPPRRRRDSGDRISFDSIARLVQPSAPPRPYDTLTPVAKSDLRPPALPEAVGAKSASPRRGGTSLALKVVAALAAVALGAVLSHALRGEPGAALPPAQVVAGAAIAPGSGAEEASARATASDEVVRLDEQVLPTMPETSQESTGDTQAERDDESRPAREEAAARGDDEARGARGRAGDDGAQATARATARATTGTEAEGEPRATGEDAEDAAAEPPALETAEQAETETETETETEATTEPAEGAAPAADLPLHPTREDVQRTMLGALPAIRECAAGQNGTVQVEVTAGSSGRVRNAVITGSFSGTPEGSCMARAMRGVRFPRFTQESFSVRYPFQI